MLLTDLFLIWSVNRALRQCTIGSYWIGLNTDFRDCRSVTASSVSLKSGSATNHLWAAQSFCSFVNLLVTTRSFSSTAPFNWTKCSFQNFYWFLVSLACCKQETRFFKKKNFLIDWKQRKIISKAHQPFDRRKSLLTIFDKRDPYMMRVIWENNISGWRTKAFGCWNS